MKTIWTWLLCALVAATSGCASVETAKSELGSGTSRVYSSQYDTVWDSAIKALASLGLSITEQDRINGTLAATRSVSAFSYGERIALRITRDGESQTRIEVISKRAFALNVTATDWEPIILQRISDSLPGAATNAFTALQGDAARAYADFEQKPYPKAFVVADGGKWAAVWKHRSRAKEDAVAEEALERCKGAGHINCKLYAVNDTVVWKP